MLTNPLAQNNGTTAAGSDAVALNNDNATKDMFTKLLVAQIRNQDPLAPSDPTQFVNQLSQLSQTEALQSLTKTTSASASLLQSLQVLAMGGQVGGEVSIAASRVQVGDTPIRGSVTLATAGAPSVTLTGADGRAHSVTLPFRAAGAAPFALDPVALGLPPGSYAISATSHDGSSAAVEVTGRVDSVRVNNGSVILQVAGVGDVDPSSITAFNGKSGTALAAAN